MTRAVLVFNGASGAHLDAERKSARAASADLLRQRGLDVEVLRGPLRRQVRQSLQSEADCVVVDGGDGTIRTVIAAHVAQAHKSGRDAKPIGILPGGTMNLLAQDYGVPLDRAAAAAAVAQGLKDRSSASVDVGLVAAGRRAREEVFLHTCLTGLPVRIGVHRERWRGRMPFGGQLRLAWHALATTWRDPAVTATLSDGKSFTGRSFAVVVGEIGDRLVPVPSRSNPNAGCLTVITLAADTGLELVRLAVVGALHRIDADPAADVSATQTATLSGKRSRMHIMLDGESMLLRMPMELSVLRDAIRILSPNQGADPAP